MRNEIAKPPSDSFDYDPLADYTGDDGRPQRSMQGDSKLKFNDPNWSVNDVLCNDRVLICYDRTFAAIHWGEPGEPPIKVEPLRRGEKPPDLKERNEKIPREDWRIGFNGEPEPPWQLQRVLEFLDFESGERLSWPSNVTVIGSSIAAEELERRIKIVRRLRNGDPVYPQVKLTHTLFPTRYRKDRQRPYLEIVGWIRFTDKGGLEAITSNVMPETTPQITDKKSPTTQLQAMSEPSLSEEMDDKISY
jgi:hypothetical protein